MNARARRKGRRRFGSVVQDRSGLFQARWEESGRRRAKRGFPTRTAADAYLACVRAGLADGSREAGAPLVADVTIGRAIEAYETHRREKGNKERALGATTQRLRAFFTEPDALVLKVTPSRCAALYDEARARVSPRTGRPYATDTHRNMLCEARSLLKFCVSRRWIARNPVEGIEGKGKRRHGKPQLRIDEARRWMATATALADAGDTGATAAMMALLLGMRASEIVSSVVRDLDDDGRLLLIPDSKTDAGRRTLRVPEALRGRLKALAHGRAPDAPLLGAQHWRDFVRRAVRQICHAAKVPIVSAHSMRGLHSTLAMEAGVTGAIVAASLGHESVSTTMQSYAKPEAVAAAQQAKVLSILEGAGSAN